MDNNNISTNLRMTAEVWNALQDMMNVSQLNDFIENIDYIQEKLISDPVVTNCIEDLGGSDKVLLMLNAFNRMRRLFKTINIALEAKRGRYEQTGDRLQRLW